MTPSQDQGPASAATALPVGASVPTACAPTKEQLPPDERLDARSGEQNETGLGPPQRTQFVQVNRVLGVLRDVVSIRYTH